MTRVLTGADLVAVACPRCGAAVRWAPIIYTSQRRPVGYWMERQEAADGDCRCLGDLDEYDVLHEQAADAYAARVVAEVTA